MTEHERASGELVDWRLSELEKFKEEVRREIKETRSVLERMEKSLHSYKMVMRFAMGVSSVLGAVAAFVADFFFKR